MNKQKTRRKFIHSSEGKSIFGDFQNGEVLSKQRGGKSFKFPYHWILLYFIIVNKITKKNSEKKITYAKLLSRGA